MRTYLPREVLDMADSMDFDRSLKDSLSSLDFHAALPNALAGLKQALVPAPIVVSARPDAGRIARQQRAASGQPQAMPSVLDAPPPTPSTPGTPYTPGGSQPSGSADIASGAAMPSSSAAPVPSGPPPQAGGDLRAYARGVAAQYGLDPDVFERQIDQESGFNPQAVSPAGAKGIAQFMPACVTIDTEILTARGWLNYTELRIGERIISYNAETDVLEPDEVQAVYAFDAPEVVRMVNKRFDFISTPDHRWYVRKGHNPAAIRRHKEKGYRLHDHPTVVKRTEDLNINIRHDLIRVAPFSFRDEPLHSDDLVQLCGWVFSDGSIGRKGHQVDIYQSERANPAKCDEIDRLVTAIGGRLRRPGYNGDGMVRWCLTGEGAAQVTDLLGADKRITVTMLERLTRSQAELLYRSCLDGDGHTIHGRYDCFVQSDIGRAEDFQLLCLFLGRIANIQVYARKHATSVFPGGRTYPNKPKAHVNVRVKQTTQTDKRRMRHERIVEPTTVWCPSTRNETWVAKRGGMVTITGNTAQGMGLADPFEPYSALDAAARHMRDNLARNGGDYARALAAYNAGQGAVDQYGGVPPFEETQRYIRTILGGRPAAPAPTAGVSPTSAAPSSQPPAGPAQTTPAPVGGSVTIRNRQTGAVFTVGPLDWRNMTNKDLFDVVPDQRQSMAGAAGLLDQPPQTMAAVDWNQPAPGERPYDPDAPDQPRELIPPNAARVQAGLDAVTQEPPYPLPEPSYNDPTAYPPSQQTVPIVQSGGDSQHTEPPQPPYVAPATYNDPTAYPPSQQTVPYTGDAVGGAPDVAAPSSSPPVGAAADPGGAVWRAQDYGSTPPLQDDRWRDEGPRESRPQPYAPSQVDRYVPSYAPQAAQTQPYAPRPLVDPGVARAVADNPLNRPTPYAPSMREGSPQVRAFDVAQATEAEVQALQTEARQLIASAPDQETAQRIRDGYTQAIADAQQRGQAKHQQIIDDAQQTGRQIEANQLPEGGQSYGSLDRAWDAADRVVGGAIRAVNQYYSDWIRKPLARPVTDIMGEEQLGHEASGIESEAQSIFRQYGRDPSQWPPDVRTRVDQLQRQVNAVYGQGGRYASERAPGTEGARTGVDLALGAATMALLPGGEVEALMHGTRASRLGAAGRVIGSGILDPLGTAGQIGLEGIGPAARGLGRGVQQGAEALGRGARAVGGAWDEAGRVAREANAADRLRPGGAPAYGTLGVSPARAPEPPSTPAPTFYSQLRRTIEEKMPNRAAPGQVQGILKGGQVKPDEIAWTGIDDWLKEQKGPVTKQQVLDFLDQNAVQVEEVVKGGGPEPLVWRESSPGTWESDGYPLEIERRGEWFDVRRWDDPEEATDIGTYPTLQQAQDEAYAEYADDVISAGEHNPTKYGNYTLPGGENYRELLLTLPQRTPDTLPEGFTVSPGTSSRGAKFEVYGPGVGRYASGETEAEAIQNFHRMHGENKPYTSSHWAEPNVLAHVRFNDRVSADGKKTLLIEEVQSDWHQAGRKKGYAGPPDPPAVVEARNQRMAELDRLLNDPNTPRAESQALSREYVTLRRQTGHDPNLVPDAPFEKQWSEIAVKRMMRWAAENGYDRVAWPRGEVHAPGRYGTERLSWQKKPNGYRLNVEAQVLGAAAGIADIGQEALARGLIDKGTPVLVKSLADVKRVLAEARGIEAPGAREIAENRTMADKLWARMQGADAGVYQPRAEGMAGFYDQALPNTAQKLGKKFGARVGTTEIALPNTTNNAGRGQRLQVNEFAGQHYVVDTNTGQRVAPTGVDGFATRAEAEHALRAASSETQTVHSLDITPAMRESVLQQGQPLFATPGVSPTRGSGLAARALTDASNSLGGGIMGAAVGAGTDPEDPQRGALRGAAVGMVAGPLAGRAMRRGEGALATPGVGPNQGPRRFANPADALQAAQKAIGTPNPRGPTAGLSKMEELRRWIVRQGTDNRVDLNEMQTEARRLLGRPLEADEMVVELSRANPSGAAKVMIDDVVKPAVQDVGDQRENLSTLMRLMNNGDVAAATGNPQRVFSGGLTGADSQAAAQHLWSTLAPEQQKTIDQSSDLLYRMVDHYRDEMVRAGVWTPQLAADLKQQYPHWVPTKILDYMNDPATASTGSRSISLHDRGLRAYTFDGTAKAAEDPIASLVRYVQDAESVIQKNETFNAFVNLRDRVPGWDQMMREVPTGFTPARAQGEKTVTGFVNGERKTYVVPAPMAAAIQMEQGQQVPILRNLTQLFKEFITRTPMFVAGQVPLDAFAYTVRETGREGGLAGLPRVVGELGRGYAEAFKGLLDGSFHGDAARYLREGGGMAGFYERAADAASKTVDDITRRNMLEVRSPREARQLATWLLTGGPVTALGARVELAPRVASFRLGERRALQAGASPEKAALEGMVGGRDVTLDFQRGGATAKIVNQIVPFFNVGIQSATTLPRMMRENPKGTATALLSLVAAPTMAAEWWNQSDPQRAQDYQDVPDYVKDRGIVIMLPGVTGRDERGEKRPNYALIPMRELAPVAILARELAQRALTGSGRPPMEMAGAMLSAASPVQASGAADLFSSTLPPLASTGLQLAADRDFFRGGPIATERRDENASALAHGIAGATGYRPSQVDFGIRDVFGGAGAMASAASDIVAGKKKDEDRIQNAPLVGGMLSRFVGDAVGGNLNRAQDAMLTPTIRRAAREAGMRDDQITPVPSDIRDLPINRREQALYQREYTRLLDEGARDALADPEWKTLTSPERERWLRNIAAHARREAGGGVVEQWDDATIEQRADKKVQKKTGTGP